MTTPAKTLLQSRPLHMAVGFMLMGGWACYANADHAWHQAVIAGLVQGTLSAFLTGFLKTTTDILRAKFTGYLALILPPLMALFGSVGILVLVHSLAGTPEIMLTLMVPLIVSSIYVFCYNTLQIREETRYGTQRPSPPQKP